SSRSGSASWLRTLENPVRADSSDVWRARYIARRSGGAPGFVVASSTPGHAVRRAARACASVTPSRSRAIMWSHDEVVDVKTELPPAYRPVTGTITSGARPGATP